MTTSRIHKYGSPSAVSRETSQGTSDLTPPTTVRFTATPTVHILEVGSFNCQLAIVIAIYSVIVTVVLILEGLMYRLQLQLKFPDSLLQS